MSSPKNISLSHNSCSRGQHCGRADFTSPVSMPSTSPSYPHVVWRTYARCGASHDQLLRTQDMPTCTPAVPSQPTPICVEPPAGWRSTLAAASGGQATFRVTPPSKSAKWVCTQRRTRGRRVLAVSRLCRSLPSVTRHRPVSSPGRGTSARASYPVHGAPNTRGWSRKRRSHSSLNHGVKVSGALAISASSACGVT